MTRLIKELVQYRDLLYMLTWKEIHVRYKQSVMGILWAIFMPVLIVGAGILMRVGFSFRSGHHINVTDIMSVSVKAVAWAFFVGAVKFGANSLINNNNLVTKVYFPREILPLASVFANFFDFVIASGFVAVVMMVLRAGVSVQLLWVPLLLLILMMITCSFALFLACANLFFRDVKYIVEIVFTYGILFTPVFYSAQMFGKWATLFLLNPLGSVLECLDSAVVLHHAPNLAWLAYAASIAVLSLLLSSFIFERAEPLFAQEI